MAKLSKTFCDQIRDAINNSGKTRYKIWQETGISQTTLSRFMSGERGLTAPVLDKLAVCIGIEVSQVKPRRRGG